MIRPGLAQALQALGVAWVPARGDRFMVPDRDMDDEVFVVSDMVVEVIDRPSGQVIGFNGTTEWALDSLAVRDVVWLPGEGQLRELLGPHFVQLQAHAHGFTVTVDVAERAYLDDDAENAYAKALLAVLTA